jgi:hypothetical protein
MATIPRFLGLEIPKGKPVIHEGQEASVMTISQVKLG